MSWQIDADAATLEVLKTFNHRPQFDQVKSPQLSKVVMGHKRNFRSEETEYVNAYGAHGCEFICRASDFPSPPEKFDTFTLNGEVYVIQDVRRANGFNNTVISYNCLCRGI